MNDPQLIALAILTAAGLAVAIPLTIGSVIGFLKPHKHEVVTKQEFDDWFMGCPRR